MEKHIYVKTPISITTHSGLETIEGVVLNIKEIRGQKDTNLNIVLEIYKSAEALEANAQAITTMQVNIPNVVILEELIPLIQVELENSKSWETSNLVLAETPWHTTDKYGQPIDLTLRRKRAFFTHKQVTYFSENYPELISRLLTNGVPRVDNGIGIWGYFEEFDADTVNNPVKTLLDSVGVYTEEIN